MKIITNSTTAPAKTYSKGAPLKPDWLYADKDGDIVATDWNGKPACVFHTDDEGFSSILAASAIEWPLSDTKITKVTVAV